MKQKAKIKFSAPLGAGLVILSSFFYASYGIWIKLLGNFFDGFTITSLRSLLVVIILLSIAIYSHKLEPLNLSKNWKYILGIMLGAIVTWGPLYFAVLSVGVGVSLTVTYASIVIGMLFFGRLFAGEHFTGDKAIASFLGLVGLLLIFSPNLYNFGWFALGGAIISGLSTALTNVFAKKIQYGSTQSTLTLWTTGGVANFIMAILLHRTYPTFHFQIQWLYLIIFALASVVASWSLVRAVKLIDAGAAGILGLLEIVFAVLFGIIFFHEKLSLVVTVGIISIIAAASVEYLKGFRFKK